MIRRPPRSTPLYSSAASDVYKRQFVKRFALCYRTFVCRSCPVLSVCPVCKVGVLWPNGLTDQNETWQAGRPRPWPHCVRCGPSSLSPKGAQAPIFGPYLLWPNGWINQDGTWHGGRPRPRRVCVRWGLSYLQKKKAQARHLPQPNFWPVFCGQMAGWIKMVPVSYTHLTLPTNREV